MVFKKLNLFSLNWVCKCGNRLAEDRNFCVQCGREKPFKH